MHDADQYMLVAKTAIVGVISGVSGLAGVVFAQAQNVIPSSAEGTGVTAILAVAVASTLGSMVYLFQLDKKNAHELKIKEQETRQKELDNEGQKSELAARDRKSREDALMQLAMVSQRNLEICAAERRSLQEKLTYVLEKSDAITSNRDSITDSSTRRKFIDKDPNHGKD